jgi:hypothetical protein
MPQTTLAALCIERRALSIALFRSTSLEDVLVRRVVANLPKAKDSVVEFINQTLARHPTEFVTLLRPARNTGRQVRTLYSVAISAVRSATIPLSEVDEHSLFDSFGHPPLRRREQLRNVGRTLWPTLTDIRARSAADATALGLHVQVERLFNNKPDSP